MNKFNWKIAAIGFAIALGFLPSQDAHSGIVKVHVTGQVDDWDGGLGAQFSVGDVLSMSYTFDTQAVDKETNFDTYGIYDFLGFEGMLGSYSFKAGSSFATTSAVPGPFGDQFFVYGEDFIVGADVAAAKLVIGSLAFRDYEAGFLIGDDLPAVAPDLSIFEIKGFLLGFDTPNGDRILVRATLDSTSTQVIGNATVPEPNSLAVAIVLGVLATVRTASTGYAKRKSFCPD